MIDRYAKRPETMGGVCLADFIACYTFKGNGRSTQAEDDGEGDDNNDAAHDVNNEDEVVTSRARPVIKLDDGQLHPRKHPKVIRFCRFDVNKEPLEYFREQVMLFKPWKNEQTEVEVENIASIFNEHKTTIKDNAKKYSKLDANIDELLQQIMENRESEQDDNWDNEINPDHVNEYEPDANLPEPNILFDVGQEARARIEAKKYSMPDMIPDDEYYDLCSSLNEEQKDYLMHLINNIKTSKEPQYNFITGSAGTGKSRLIKAIYQSLNRYYRRDAGPAGKVQVALIAPTGKAAHNIGGETAHHFFGLPFGAKAKDTTYHPPNAEKLNTMRTDLCDLKVIIIDEISMMGYSILNSIHLTLNHVYRNSDPNRIFGGRSVIVFGDFNQLQPVFDSFCFAQPSANPLSQISGNIIWNEFTMFRLTKIMRQRNDATFAEGLNRLAVGASTDEDMAMFNRQVYKEQDLPEEGKRAIRLIYKNDDVKDYNKLRMTQLRTSDTRYKKVYAHDTFPKEMHLRKQAELRALLQTKEKKKLSASHGLLSMLRLQIGVHYMVTCNVDVTDGLFNGAIGILRDFEQQGELVSKVYMEFDEQSIGKKARKANREGQLWTPLVVWPVTFAITNNLKNTVSIFMI